MRLLALAGGPQGGGARAEDVAQDGTVAIFRPGVGVIYQATIEEFVTNQRAPAMEDGDALQVEVVIRNRVTFRTVVQTVGSVAALVLVAFRLGDAISGN